MMTTLLLFVTLLLLTLLSAASSAAEISLFSLSMITLKSYRKHGSQKKQWIADQLQRPRELFVTLFIINVTINLLLQNVSSTFFGQDSGWLLTVGLPFTLVLLFGEIIPKYVALHNNEALAEFFILPIQMVEKLLRPMREFILKVSLPLSHLCFRFLKEEAPLDQREMKQLLLHLKEREQLNPLESKLILGYLDLQKQRCKQLMRPREEILYYDIGDPLSSLLHLFQKEECSRIPVCEDSLQKPLGIIDSTTFFLHREMITTSADLLPLLQPCLFLPENSSVKQLFIVIQTPKLALIVDEYGSITGLISQEDLVEVVVGDIIDRRDEQSKLTHFDGRILIAKGSLEIDQFNSLFQAHLKSLSGMVTLGGWLVESMEEIPQAGSSLEREGFYFHVLEADEKRIGKFYARRI